MMSRLDASQVEAGGEIAGSPRSPSFPQPTTAAEATHAPKPAVQAAGVPAEPSAEDVKRAAAQLETFMQSMNRYLEFRVDEDSGRTVVTVKDKTTGETIRQIPSEEVMRLAHNLGGKTPAALVNETA
jgi:flagellar protein FlaG